MTKAHNVFIKLAKKVQERTEDYNTGKTVYKPGDDTPEKKKIVDQIANQHTTQNWKKNLIKDDWKNTTVTADTTFNQWGDIDNVRHKVKHHKWWLPSLFEPEYQTVRDRNRGIMNVETHNDIVREDPNPPVSNLFPPEGLNKEEMIKLLKNKKK